MNNYSEIVQNVPQGATKSQIEAWNQSVASIESYMMFMFIAVVVIMLTQLVITVQLQKNGVIELFDGEGRWT